MLARCGRVQLRDVCGELLSQCFVSDNPSIQPLQTHSLIVWQRLQIGVHIEGQHVNLESLVRLLCEGEGSDCEQVTNAIKNVLFTEATRKSYCHEKRALLKCMPLTMCMHV